MRKASQYVQTRTTIPLRYIRYETGLKGPPNLNRSSISGLSTHHRPRHTYFAMAFMDNITQLSVDTPLDDACFAATCADNADHAVDCQHATRRTTCVLPRLVQTTLTTDLPALVQGGVTEGRRCCGTLRADTRMQKS